ncbi:MAG TPA: MauE/DoxX family redox-associated membrane protein [Chthoniobacteraceae bacterium]|jgi:uncharacterized membrane protein YphA (DoxX/SURF4 family)|nr:MauE/DoxX family redox-associated membrane protein [Chthoniobacteraceae bacterium]
MKVAAIQWRSAAWALLALLLSGVFLFAGVMKLREGAPFAGSIARFQLLPESFIHPVALGLPILEVFCALALVIGPWKRPAALGIVLLCTTFLLALVSAGARGLSVECSCFGAVVAEPLGKLIARDLVLLTAAGAIYLRHLGRNLPSVRVRQMEQ